MVSTFCPLQDGFSYRILSVGLEMTFLMFRILGFYVLQEGYICRSTYLSIYPSIDLSMEDLGPECHIHCDLICVRDERPQHWCASMVSSVRRGVVQGPPSFLARHQGALQLSHCHAWDYAYRISDLAVGSYHPPFVGYPTLWL